MNVFASVPKGYGHTIVDSAQEVFKLSQIPPVPGKKDFRKSGFIAFVQMECDSFFVTFFKQRMDRCQLISVNITFSMPDGHFGELLSHTVTVGQFTVLTFTTLFTLVDHEAAFFSALRCTNIAVVVFDPFWIVRLRNNPGIDKTNNIPIMIKPHDHWVICNNKKV